MLFLCHTHSDSDSLEESYPFAGIWLSPTMVAKIIGYIEEMQNEVCVEKIYSTTSKFVFFGTSDDRPAMILSYAEQDYVIVDPTFPKEVEFDEAQIENLQIHVTSDGVMFSAVDMLAGRTLFTEAYLSQKTLKDISDETTISR